MHVTAPNRQASKEQLERESLSASAEDMFCDHPSMRYADLQVTVKTKLTVSGKTAERKVSRMRQLGIIKKSVAVLYTLAT